MILLGHENQNGCWAEKHSELCKLCFSFNHGLLAGNLKKKSAATIWKSTSLSVSMFFTAVKSRALEALVSPISLTWKSKFYILDLWIILFTSIWKLIFWDFIFPVIVVVHYYVSMQRCFDFPNFVMQLKWRLYIRGFSQICELSYLPAFGSLFSEIWFSLWLLMWVTMSARNTGFFFQFCDVSEVTIIHTRISPNLAIKITKVRKFKLLSIFWTTY